MGLFSKLFGRKKEEESKEKHNTNVNSSPQSHTAKPLQEMPSITFRNMPEDAPMTDYTLAGKMRIDILLAMGAMVGKDKAYEEEGILYDALVKNGVIRVPLVVTKENKKFGVFAFYNEEEAKHFKKFQKTLKEEAGFEECYYLSSVDPRKFSVEDGEIESDVSFTGLFRLDEKPEEKDFEGHYAMWWSDPKDPLFVDSPVATLYKKIYTALNGYETYFCGMLIAGLHNKELSRNHPPEKEVFFYTTGPNNRKCIISINKEKGIRFLFPSEIVSPSYVVKCLSIIAESFTFLRKGFEDRRIQKDQVQDSLPYIWYNELHTSITEGRLIARDLEGLTVGKPKPTPTQDRTIDIDKVLFRVKVGNTALAIHSNSTDTDIEIPENQKPAFVDFQENFILGLAQDMGHSYEFINSVMLAKTNYSKVELLDAGKVNILNEIREKIKIVGDPNTSCAMITCGGNHESALIVFDEFWNQVEEMIQSDFCMALPVRDILLVCNFYNTEALDIMRQKIRHFYYDKNQNQLQSNHIYLRKENRWKSIEIIEA